MYKFVLAVVALFLTTSLSPAATNLNGKWCTKSLGGYNHRMTLRVSGDNITGSLSAAQRIGNNKITGRLSGGQLKLNAGEVAIRLRVDETLKGSFAWGNFSSSVTYSRC